MQASALDSNYLTFEERRIAQANVEQHWDRLTTPQRFAFYTLAKLGYQLLFVRSSPHSRTAVAKQDDKLVTIDDEGDIDFNPDVVLRERRPPRH
ncbi:hypothetical protein [Shewanella colwelliana]|uniref:Uncharacterized protein n=1 Tax=Shewanella colwelliana TaxID=23 RepID=A0A1E5IWK6_SHECO|nr:hypothetical protein [Shewanella colwelliana]MCZ4338991.1 hypothetical protein [Shewanella colwelliana]MDX1283226.1 hypothetical protein [Shewanella colwelliana]OEG74896.1 hypothetical protein BEL05_12005 [Shewanella colwelliana]GIU19064.1 hypothetical protein TUM4644_06310 [Shewanella colwelliana]GIU37100.1 hypothetical protein TUM3794_07290 [Shewanella colwelliana]